MKDPNTADSFRQLSIHELVDEWDEPMSDATRALLEVELKARGYRMKSLSSAPPSDGVRSSRQALTPKELSLYRVQRGVRVILLVGLLQIAVGTFFAFFPGASYASQVAALEAYGNEELVTYDGDTMPAGEARIELSVLRVVTAGVPIALGCFFLIVYRYAKARPVLGFWLALGVYVALLGMNAVYDPSTLYRGALIKGLIVLALVYGLLGARRLANQSAVDESA